MNGFCVNLGKNYALDVAGFYLVRSFKDGLTFVELDVESSWYHDDHQPSFKIWLMVFNFIILDLTIYNTRHI